MIPVQALNDPRVKFSFATRAVPREAATGLVPLTRPPRVGELAVAEVIEVGRNTSLETRSGVSSYLFPGDTIVGVFGNRYATDQYEGYVPTEPAVECDLMSAGGLCGEVVSRHAKMAAPTRLRLLGLACGHNGAPTARSFSSWGHP